MGASAGSAGIGRIAEVTIDVSDLAVAREFWRAVLGVGIAEENSDWVLFENGTGGAGLSLQRVDEPKIGKSRSHVDVVLDDYEGGLQRLVGLGATAVRDVTGGGRRWWIMLDPDGNEFCAIAADKVDD